MTKTSLYLQTVTASYTYNIYNMTPDSKKHTYFLNPKYKFAQNFVQQLAQPGWFAATENGTVLHAGRNSIKMFAVDNTKLVVKSFGRLSMLNRIIYGRLRKSKARRAYEYAARLRELGINTPEEVAYIEKRKNTLLFESYFVSLHTDYLPMQPFFRNRTLDGQEFKQIIPLLNALTKFLHQLHEAGVIHNDLNYTNILYNYPNSNTSNSALPADEKSYSFTVIDINRMEFKKKLSLEERLHNLRRLNISEAAYNHIFREYAKIVGEDEQKVIDMGMKFRNEFVEKRKKNARLKAFLKNI